MIVACLLPIAEIQSLTRTAVLQWVRSLLDKLRALNCMKGHNDPASVRHNNLMPDIRRHGDPPLLQWCAVVADQMVRLPSLSNPELKVTLAAIGHRALVAVRMSLRSCDGVGPQDKAPAWPDDVRQRLLAYRERERIPRHR